MSWYDLFCYKKNVLHMKKIAFSLLFSMFVLANVATPVAATVAEQSQDQELKTSVTCEVGAYGQTTKCDASAYGKQRQSQKISILGASTHTMANTALDTPSLIAAAGVIIAGAGIAVKKFIVA